VNAPATAAAAPSIAQLSPLRPPIATSSLITRIAITVPHCTIRNGGQRTEGSRSVEMLINRWNPERADVIPQRRQSAGMWRRAAASPGPCRWASLSATAALCSVSTLPPYLNLARTSVTRISMPRMVLSLAPCSIGST